MTLVSLAPLCSNIKRNKENIVKILTSNIFLIFISICSIAYANNVNYWEIKLPTLDGATNISTERDERFYGITSSYEIKIKNTKELYSFYNEFFEKMGWQNPMKGFRRPTHEQQGGWSSYRTTFTPEGHPESSYSSLWKAESIPALGTVILTITGFKDGVFEAKVKVSIAPEVDNTPLHKLQNILTENPKNIFILYEATGGNPFEIDKVNPHPAEKYKDNEMVKEYYKIIDTIAKQYLDFGAKYVQK